MANVYAVAITLTGQAKQGAEATRSDLMGIPVPKPKPLPKKPKTRLKVHKRKMPDSFKKAVHKRDDYTCQLCGRPTNDPPHHIIFQSHGRNTDWIHDPRNGVTLCAICHDLPHKSREADKWRRYFERWAVKKFGWLGGQAMTLEEWEERRKWSER